MRIDPDHRLASLAAARGQYRIGVSLVQITCCARAWRPVASASGRSH
jgi:hypothetical protein